MRMSVLIVSYRRPELLKNCLRSLERQTRQPDEIIIVGVEEDRATAETVQQFAEISSIPCIWRAASVPNVVEQTNIGLALSSGEVVCFTNDDAEAFPNWLERIEPHYDDPSVGGVGGPDSIHFNGQVLTGRARRVGQISWFGRLYGSHHLSFPMIVDVDFLKGVNMSCRRCLLPALDTRLACSGVWHWELDVSLQVKRLGKRLVYDPAVCVDHFPTARPDLDPKYVYEINHNLTLAFAKHFGPWRRLAFLFYTFLWGDYPEMGLAVFSKIYLSRLVRHGDIGFIKFLGVSLRGKLDALRSLESSRSRATS